MAHPFRTIRYRIFIMVKTGTGFKAAVIVCAVLMISSTVVFFVEHERNPGFVSLYDSFWWTVVTVSTVGYGDRLPRTVTGRAVAMITIVFGVAVMGMVTGKIASRLMEHQMKEEKGLLDYSRKKHHFVICGWKREMNLVLNEMAGNRSESCIPLDIVLLNKADSEDVSVIRNDPLFKGIGFVHGDFDEERDLIRAGIRGASRVLVLADYLTKGDLQHIDSKTVMAVMSIKNLNRHAYVCAELLDVKYEKYLRLSHCDEILLSRDFSRSLLASASNGSGLAHIVRSLISGSGSAALSTIEFPDSFVGKPYADLQSWTTQHNNVQLIGLLENTGNIFLRKREALREAQKTPDISQLVPELRHVKSLEANVPVINPPKPYTIKRHSRGIVISPLTDNTAARTVEHNTCYG